MSAEFVESGSVGGAVESAPAVESSPAVTESVTPAPSPSVTPEAPKEPVLDTSKATKISGLDKLKDAAKKSQEKTKKPLEEGPVVDPALAADVVAPVVAPPAYAPNMRLKIMDKDFEIDAFLKDAIKDEKTEKKVRELYEKAIGLDFAKPKHEALQQEMQQFKKGFENLGGLIAQGRVGEFFDFWKIPKNVLYEHVAKQLQYEELPPEQKAAIEKQNAQEFEARQAKEQHAQLLNQHQQTLVQHRQSELETAISRPDVSQIAQEYDSRHGAGKFREAIIYRGRVAAVVDGKDIPVTQALSEVMSMLGYTEQDAPEQAASAPVVAPVAQKKLPVLPNIGSNGASPVKKSINSIAEMRALSKQMRNA